MNNDTITLEELFRILRELSPQEEKTIDQDEICEGRRIRYFESEELGGILFATDHDEVGIEDVEFESFSDDPFFTKKWRERVILRERELEEEGEEYETIQ